MKKYCLLILLFLFMLSCENSEPPSSEFIPNLKTFDKYDKIGQLHNDILAYGNLEFRRNITFRNDPVQVLFEKLNSLGGMDESGSLYDNEDFNKFLAENLSGDFITNYKNEMQEYISGLIENNDAAQADLDIVVEMIDFFKSKEEIDINEIDDKLLELKNSWLSEEFVEGSRKGDISGYTISIAIHSLQFWSENEDAFSNIHNIGSTYRILPIIGWFVARDAAGCLTGHILAEAYDDLIGPEPDGTASESDFAKNCVTGAAAASAGL